jgi:L-ascorbate metabolism protein UlaG (beta-lactamase superfamily)
MSHDHYDHLDYQSIQKLKHKTNHFYTALGVAKHLRRWGIDNSKITEMDWQDEIQIDGVKLIFTESRHFSGRRFSDRFKCLWGGWIIAAGDKKIYWSGDGGYGLHFKEIGEKYGPFDIGFMECGQYNPNWKDIHLTPEESVQAALDAKVKTAMPVHCMGFALAMHPWQEPLEKFYAAAAEYKLKTTAPKIGAIEVI